VANLTQKDNEAKKPPSLTQEHPGGRKKKKKRLKIPPPTLRRERRAKVKDRDIQRAKSRRQKRFDSTMGFPGEGPNVAKCDMRPCPFPTHLHAIRRDAKDGYERRKLEKKAGRKKTPRFEECKRPQECKRPNHFHRLFEAPTSDDDRKQFAPEGDSDRKLSENDEAALDMFAGVQQAQALMDQADQKQPVLQVVFPGDRQRMDFKQPALRRDVRIPRIAPDDLKLARARLNQVNAPAGPDMARVFAEARQQRPIPAAPALPVQDDKVQCVGCANISVFRTFTQHCCTFWCRDCYVGPGYGVHRCNMPQITEQLLERKRGRLRQSVTVKLLPPPKFDVNSEKILGRHPHRTTKVVIYLATHKEHYKPIMRRFLERVPGYRESTLLHSEHYPFSAKLNFQDNHVDAIHLFFKSITVPLQQKGNSIHSVFDEMDMKSSMVAEVYVRLAADIINHDEVGNKRFWNGVGKAYLGNISYLKDLIQNARVNGVPYPRGLVLQQTVLFILNCLMVRDYFFAAATNSVQPHFSRGRCIATPQLTSA